MKILALDLGKFKSVACDYESETGRHSFATIPTNPQDFIEVDAAARFHGAPPMLSKFGGTAIFNRDPLPSKTLCVN